MIKIVDIIVILVVVIMALILAEKPNPDLDPRISVRGKAVQGGQLSVAGEKQPVRGVEIQVNKGNAENDLRARNIFTANGSYTGSDNVPMRANPYTLVGVTQGRETKAIFRDYKGSVAALTAGQKMSDGSVISRIDGDSVQLKKGEEKTELKVFNVPNREKTILSEP